MRGAALCLVAILGFFPPLLAGDDVKLRAAAKAAEKQLAEVAQLWRLRGHLLVTQSRFTEARKAYAEALAIYRRLAATSPKYLPHVDAVLLEIETSAGRMIVPANPCSAEAAMLRNDVLDVRHCLGSYAVVVACYDQKGKRLKPYAMAALSRDHVRVFFDERVSARCEVHLLRGEK